MVVSGQHKSEKEKIANLFAQSQKVYEQSAVFKMNMAYKFFPSYKTGIPSQKYEGVFFKKDSDYYSKINKTEFLKIKEDYIKIDHGSKLAEIKKMVSTEGVGEVYDLSKFMTNFTTFKLSSEGDSWVCTMTAPAITFVPYAKVIVFIDKKKLTISKQVLYFLTKNEYTDNQGKKVSDYPRMEILFTSFENKNVELGSKFKWDNYIEKKGKKNSLAKKYTDKGYKIVD